MSQAKCPICELEIKYKLERYPNLICSECHKSNDIKDSNGFPVSFENESIYGGFISLHTIDNKLVSNKDHYCFVKGIRCYADEARFGGIVIQRRVADYERIEFTPTHNNMI